MASRSLAVVTHTSTGAAIVTGWKNKLQTAVASVTPAGILAEQHRRQAEPGSGCDR